MEIVCAGLAAYRCMHIRTCLAQASFGYCASGDSFILDFLRVQVFDSNIVCPRNNVTVLCCQLKCELLDTDPLRMRLDSFNGSFIEE